MRFASMWIKKLLAFSFAALSLVLWAATAQAASFDCSKTNMAIEKMICADAEDWINAIEQACPKDIPPIAGQGSPKPRESPFPPAAAYVVLQDFTYPAGLYGAYSVNFIIPKGVPIPKGNPGHSSVYDFNTLTCEGPPCDRD